MKDIYDGLPPEIRKKAIALKNLLNDITDQAVEQGLTKKEVVDTIKSALKTLEKKAFTDKFSKN